MGEVQGGQWRRRTRVAAASLPQNVSPPICISADLLTEALMRVTFYCTGKQKH